MGPKRRRPEQLQLGNMLMLSVILIRFHRIASRISGRGVVAIVAVFWGLFGVPIASHGADSKDQSRPLEFDRIVVDADMPGGYQVEVADVDGDGKLDVVGLGNGVCAWYQNPTWRKRIVTTPKQTPGIISTATADIDRDGKAEIAIGYDFEMNEPKRGKLLIARQGNSIDDPWKIEKIEAIGSVHRLRFGDLDGDGRLELVVAPIFGPEAEPPAFQESFARLIYFKPSGLSANQVFTWERHDLGEFLVMHAIEAIDATGDGAIDVLSASNEGVSLTTLDRASGGRPHTRRLVPGAAGTPPKRGSSEIHLGKLRGGKRFLATIDPWHGTDVSVCLEAKPDSLVFGARTVVDATLSDGHALWVADFDGDGDDEIVAGHRGKDHRVSIYDFDGKLWNRTVLDRAIAAQDLRGGDIDGDGKPDVVAIGGSTHNVVLFKPKSR